MNHRLAIGDAIILQSPVELVAIDDAAEAQFMGTLGFEAPVENQSQIGRRRSAVLPFGGLRGGY